MGPIPKVVESFSVSCGLEERILYLVQIVLLHKRLLDATFSNLRLCYKREREEGGQGQMRIRSHQGTRADVKSGYIYGTT